MSPVKELNLTYEALNQENTLSSGDTVTGTLTFTLAKETKVKNVRVRIKGDASVHWTEGTGDNRKSYNAYKSYFKVKEYLIAEDSKGNVLPEGVHRFKFSLKIPQEHMPPSFNGFHGKIVYMLEAKLSRKWHFPSTAQTELKFVSKSFPQLGQMAGSVSKEMSFSKGEVQISATVDRNACSPGETLSIGAKFSNSSSKKTRPKFSVRQRTVYHARCSRKISDQNICKVVGDTIGPNSEETVTCQLTIPENINHTVHNCDIISVDYYVKVYLDISFSIDPEVVFPLVVGPFGFSTHQPGPYPAAAVGAPSCSDFPAPAFPFGAYPVPAGPGAFGYPAPNPAQHANITSGYNNPFPQQAAPYGFSSAAFPPPSVQHQAPTAPPLFQPVEEPPSYMSIFPPSVNSSSGSDGKT